MLKKKLFLLLAMVVASVGSMFAQAFDPKAVIPADPAVRVGVLDNGLTYYIRQNSIPENQAEFYIFHNVGAIQEEDSQQGLAHFLEHMAFNGTKHFPGNGLIDWLESIGVKFGANLNAGTGVEMTYYMMSSVPIARETVIDSALLILHDWSYFITLEDSAIDKERGVIVEELRTRNTGSWRAFEEAAQYMYGDTKYTYRNVIGHEEGLRSFDYQELRDFYHRWYRTDQQAIVIVGDFDPDMMEAKVKAVMADIPAVENPEPKDYIVIPGNEEPVVGIITDPELTSTTATIYIKRQALPLEFNSLNVVYLQNMVDHYISIMASERLRDITLKPGAPFTSAAIGMNGHFTTTTDAAVGRVTAREGEALDAFAALYVEMEKIARFGFTESEFERAKTQILRNAQQQYDSRNDRRSEDFVWAYIDNFYQNSPMPSADHEWELDQQMIDYISLDLVNMFAKERISHQNQIVIINAPEKEGVFVPTAEQVAAVIQAINEAEIDAPVDNSITEPLIPAGTKLKGSKVKKTSTDKFGSTVWELKNGVTVVVKQTDFKSDEILMNITRAGGYSALATEDIMSASNLPGYMSQAGVGNFNASDLRKQLTGKAVNLGPTVRSYSNGFTGSASPKDIETLMQLTYLYFTAPRFDESDFDVMTDRLRSQYANIVGNPMFILNDSLTTLLYDHNPRRSMLSLETIEEIEFAKMQSSYEAMFSNPSEFTFTFVGNVNLDELKPMVEKYLGSLPKSKKTSSWVDDGVRYSTGHVDSNFKVPMQMPKTTVLMVYTGELEYNMNNDILLKSLSQILNMRYTESVREERGGTYGVGVQAEVGYVPVNDYYLLITFDTDPAMADELIEVIFEEINLIAAEGVRADDLAKIKEFYAKQYPDNIKKNRYWIGTISEYYMNGHDMDTGFMDVINSMGQEEFKALATKILEDDNLLKIVMTNE